MTHLRRAIASSLLLQPVVSLGTPARALAAEALGTKQACLAAADEGQSLRDDSKHRLAREQFLACAHDICPRIVRDQCTEWLRQLDEATPTVVFGAKDDNGNDVTSARVSADGKLITDHLDGKPVPLDPGPHDILFEREGSAPVTVHVVLRTGEKNRDVSPINPALFLLNERSNGNASSGDVRRTSFQWDARNVTSLSLLVGGVAATALGVVFAAQSHSRADHAATLRLSMTNYACVNGGGAACQALSDAVDEQNRDGVLTEGLYVAGGVLAAAAVTTWLVWPMFHKDRKGEAWAAPALGGGRVGMSVGGAF